MISNILKFKKIFFTIVLVLIFFNVFAQPCVTPGDPPGCEIDDPIDSQIVFLIVAVTGLAIYKLKRKRLKLAI